MTPAWNNIKSVNPCYTYVNSMKVLNKYIYIYKILYPCFLTIGIHKDENYQSKIINAEHLFVYGENLNIVKQICGQKNKNDSSDNDNVNRYYMGFNYIISDEIGSALVDKKLFLSDCFDPAGYRRTQSRSP